MLHHILRTEGVTGLYRGLTPRLLIYISQVSDGLKPPAHPPTEHCVTRWGQGAIFFGSYEFLKGALP